MSSLLYFNPEDKTRAYGWADVSEGIKADEAGQETVPTDIEIMHVGDWDTPNHGRFSIGEADLEQYVQNFNAGVRKGVPIDLEHNTTGGAVGWIKGLSKVGQTLRANVEWTKAGSAALADRAYKYISPEFAVAGYKDPEGKITSDRNVLLGGALTNRPLFKNLQAIVANDTGTKKAGDESTSSLTGDSGTDNNSNNVKEGAKMQLDDIRTKEASALTDEEKTFLSEHKAELSEAELTKFSLAAAPAAKKEGEGTGDNKDATASGAVATPAAAAVAASDSKKGVEGVTVTISASELADLKQAAELGVKAHQTLQHKEASDKVGGYITANQFKPGGKDAITKFYLGLTPEQQATFDKDVVGSIQDKVVAAGEVGSDSQGSIGSAAVALNKRAEEIMASDKVDIRTAINKAKTENPELSTAYQAEVAAGK